MCVLPEIAAALAAAAPEAAGTTAAVAGDAFLPGLLGAGGGAGGLLAGTGAIAGDAFLPGLLGQTPAGIGEGSGLLGALGKLGGAANRLGKVGRMGSALQMSGLFSQPQPAMGGAAPRPPMGQGEPMPNVAQRMGGTGMVPPGTMPPQLMMALRAQGIDPATYLRLMQQMQARGG